MVVNFLTFIQSEKQHNMKIASLLLLMTLHLSTFGQTYNMPHENDPHEGTWLQWPHQYEYGLAYRNSLDATWVAMTDALVDGEKVHIIAYDNTQKNRIITLLTNAGVSLTNVDFLLFETNDVWARDNGPIFVRNSNGDLLIEDWGFNGWGGKFNSDLCDPIPTSVASAISLPVINLNSVMTNEGGAVEFDGNGVFMACRSSILSQSPANSVRNPGMTQAQAESIFSQYLGVTKFIWLDGNVGVTEDITDFHIDGFAKFLNDDTLVTMNNADLVYWGASASDISTLYGASNVNNTVYTKVYVPLTQNDVVTTNGNNLGYKGSYVNYYVANNVVLVPNYNDPNDVVANGIIQTLYPDRTVVGIDCRNLYEWGGMVHCVTQQQPVSTVMGLNENNIKERNTIQNFPNPFSEMSTINITLKKVADVSITIYNALGQLVSQQNLPNLSNGKHALTLDAKNLPNGSYNYTIVVANQGQYTGQMTILH